MAAASSSLKIDLHLQPRDSTELRGTYGPWRAPITLRRSRAQRG